MVLVRFLCGLGLVQASKRFFSDNPAVMAKILRNAALCLLASTLAGQKAGMHVAEEHPGLSMWECNENSCSKESKWTSFTSGPHVNLRGDMPL